ncbi:MAG: hypothetical protein H0V12_06335 [Chloroflexi bacterium]|nr:hypothetical protein [Chloroflexota bacterium]
MLTFKFLHIITMFGAVTLLVGSMVFLDLVARARDIVTYRRMDAIVQRTDMVGLGLFLAGIVFGVLTALMGGFDLTASWLILSYVLVVALVIEGVVISLPWYGRIRQAASGEDDAAAAAVERMMRTPRHLASGGDPAQIDRATELMRSLDSTAPSVHLRAHPPAVDGHQRWRRCPGRASPPAGRAAHRHRRCRAHRPTPDDVFLTLTGRKVENADAAQGGTAVEASPA